MNDSWNPEPPPEIIKIQKEDLIDNTLFSKHWLFEFLLKLIKKVEEEQEQENAENVIKEIEADFEKDLCELWDMTVEKDVCTVLDEYNAIQIFEGYIRKYEETYPRANEILIGILVNMASLSEDICLKLINNKYLIQYLLFNVLSKMADVPTIIQVIRLFDVFLTSSNSIIKEKFIDYLKNELYFHSETDQIDGHNLNWKGIIEKFYFILEQSLNTELLDCTCSFLLDLLDSDDQILNAFSSNSRIVDSICNAAMTRFSLDHQKKNFNCSQFTTSRRENTNVTKTPLRLSTESKYQSLNAQISEEDISTIDYIFNKYFLCLQTLSTCESGALCLYERTEVVINLFDDYLSKCLSTFNDWEIKSAHSLKASIVPESLQNFICITSVLNCLIPHSQSNNVNLINQHFDTFFSKLFTLCKNYLSLFKDFKLKYQQQQQSQEQEQQKEFDESLEVNFNLAKTNINELLNNLDLLKENNTLNLFIEDCVKLL